MSSLEKVKAYFAAAGLADRVIVPEQSSATVEEAAAALGTEPGRIAKTLSFLVDGKPVLILFAGDARVDNKKFRQRFHTKARMIPGDQVESLIGHDIGGVCPFGTKPGIPVYLDESLKRFVTVFPAVGSGNSAIELNLDELYAYSHALEWIDVCKLPEA